MKAKVTDRIARISLYVMLGGANMAVLLNLLRRMASLEGRADEMTGRVAALRAVETMRTRLPFPGDEPAGPSDDGPP